GVLDADGSAAKITKVQGRVTIKRTGTESITTLKTGDGISAGDLLDCARNSLAQLVFTDDSVVIVWPGAALRVNQYSYAPDINRRSAIIKVLGGQARFIVYKPRMNSRFVVQTEHVSLNISRHDIVLMVSPTQTEIANIGSPLDVKNISALAVGTVRLDTNQQTVVKAKTPPSQPANVTSEQRRKYIRDANF
ncbi:MAG: FecR domain-containing protein, partial [Pseudomonadota bacterium]